MRTQPTGGPQGPPIEFVPNRGGHRVGVASNQSATRDAVDLLTAQHEEVCQLFSQVQDGGQRRNDTFECLVRLLAVHETAEEEVRAPAKRRHPDDGDGSGELVEETAED